MYLSQAAISDCITYIEKYGVQEVVLTGGGEPTHEFPTVTRFIEQASAGLFSLYTAGQWGATVEEAIETLGALQSAVSRRGQPAQVRIRLSLDGFHQEKIGLLPALNIIAELTSFPERYPDLRISIRTVIGSDQPVTELADRLGFEIETVDRHSAKLVRASGPPIDVMMLNLIPTGRYNSRIQGKPDLFDFRETLSGLRHHLGDGWPLIYAEGLNFGIRPTGKVYLYGATSEDLGRIPQTRLSTAIKSIARDPISHAIYLDGIVSVFDSLASCEEEIVTCTDAHSEPSLLIPKFCEEPRGLLLAKIVALALISGRVDGASSVLTAAGLRGMTLGSIDARMASLARIYKGERNGWKQADHRGHIGREESADSAGG